MQCGYVFVASASLQLKQKKTLASAVVGAKADTPYRSALLALLAGQRPEAGAATADMVDTWARAFDTALDVATQNLTTAAELLSTTVPRSAAAAVKARYLEIYRCGRPLP